MRVVWGFTVLCSGPIGLAGYWLSGRTQIDHDSIRREAFRSGLAFSLSVGLLAAYR